MTRSAGVPSLRCPGCGAAAGEPLLAVDDGLGLAGCASCGLACRSSRSERQPLRSHPFQALASVLLLPVLVSLALALFALEVALRSGGTVEVYARASGAEPTGGTGEAAPSAPRT